MRTYTTSQSWIEVDYGHLVGNAAAVLQRLPSGAIPVAMVQGNGYGHGLDFAAKAFLDAGFKELGVTDINEAITLRQACPLSCMPEYNLVTHQYSPWGLVARHGLASL